MLMLGDSNKKRIDSLIMKLMPAGGKPEPKPVDDEYNDAMEMMFADFMEALRANDASKAFITFKQMHRTLHYMHDMKREVDEAKEEVKEKYGMDD
jgi:hypothetical protein